MEEKTQASGFWVDGKLVNGAGLPIDEQGKVIVQKKEGEPTFESVQAELATAQERITELEGQLQASQDQGNPDSADTRTNAELRAALDTKGVQGLRDLNKAALQALAVEHGV
jgi:hypothetical protein